MFNKIMWVWWLILVVAITWLLFFKPAEAQEFEFGPQGFGFRPNWGEGYQHGYHRQYRDQRGRFRRGNCEELRRACMFKEDLGEVGQGNCRRYRETCQ